MDYFLEAAQTRLMEDFQIDHFLRQMSHVVRNIAVMLGGGDQNGRFIEDNEQEELEVMIAIPVEENAAIALQENPPAIEDVQAMPPAPVAPLPDAIYLLGGVAAEEPPYVVGEVILEDID